MFDFVITPWAPLFSEQKFQYIMLHQFEEPLILRGSTILSPITNSPQPTKKREKTLLSKL